MKEQEKLKWPECQLWFQLGLKDSSELEFKDEPLDCHVGNYGFTKTGYGKHVRPIEIGFITYLGLVCSLLPVATAGNVKFTNKDT